MSNENPKLQYLRSAAMATFVVATAAHADSVPEGDGGLDTVIVTADKRQIDLQDAPMSITSVSGDVLEKANVTDAASLSGYIPGLQMNRSGGSEVLASIRGVGSQTPENFLTQPGVSFHIDGVYIPNSIALNMGFLDVDHVEAARGPQGTVYGQSSTGGTINVIEKQPVLGLFGGEVDGSFGNYAYARGRVALNLPLGNNFAVRAVIQQTSHDGYAKSTAIAGGYDLDDANDLNYKLAALWQINDSLSLTLSSQRYKAKHNAAELKAIDDPNADAREVSQDFPGKYYLAMDVNSAVLKWDLDFATFKSTTSYQTINHIESFDSDRSTVANFGGYDTVSTWSTWGNTLMQEFTLASNTTSKIDWIGGFFYLDSHNGQYVNEYAGTDASDPVPVLSRHLDPADMPDNMSYENLSVVDRTSWAPFLQATLHVTDRFRVTGGARYNYDKYDGVSSDYYAANSPVNDSSHTTTGKLEADVDLTPTDLLYVSWSRGYKPGGVNSGATGAMVVSTTIEPEVVDAYEIGSKNRWLDNHLGVNVAAFYYSYKNMQYIQEDPIPYSGGIGNIPKTEIWGAEAEIVYKLLGEHLELGLNATTLDGKFPEHYYALDRRLADAAGADAVASGTVYPWTDAWFQARGSVATDVYGNTPPNLPKLAGGLSATWMQPVTMGALISRVEYLYRGSYEARIFNTEGADQVPSYGQWNALIEYVPENKPWTVSVTGTNLFNADGISGRFVDPYGSGVVSNQYIPPRQILMNFSYKF